MHKKNDLRSTAKELAKEYLEHPDVVDVLWFPAPDDGRLKLVLVFEPAARDSDPLRLPLRPGGWELAIQTVDAEGWADVIAGDRDLPRAWPLADAVSLAPPPAGQ